MLGQDLQVVVGIDCVRANDVILAEVCRQGAGAASDLAFQTGGLDMYEKAFKLLTRLEPTIIASCQLHTTVCVLRQRSSPSQRVRVLLTP